MAGNVAADMVVHVGADIGDATKGLSDIGSKVDGTGGKFQKASLVMAGGAAAIVGGLGLSIMGAANFEQAMAEVNAVTNLTGNEFDQLSTLAMQIGKDTSFGASEGAAAIGELAKAGVTVTDIMGGAAISAAHLAEAGGVSIPEAAIAMSNSMNMFSLAGSDAAMIADTFAAAANASAADVSSLSAGLAQGGPAAASFGISLQDTVAALALFSNYGIQGSDAGTSLKTMLQSLANPSTEAAAKMAELGIQAFDASGNFIGMEALSGQLSTALSGLTTEQKNAALAMIFGSDASRVAGILAKEGAEGFAEMADSVKDQGAAGRMAAKRMDTLNGAIEQLKGSLETAMIVVGGAFIPAIRGMADGIIGLINGFLTLSPNIQKFVGFALAAVAGALALGAAISGIIGFLAPAAAGFVALLGPIALILAAVIGLYVAWKTNFLGIQDIVTGFFGVVMPVISAFADFLTKVAKGGTAAKSAMEGIPKPLQNIAQVLALVVRGFTSFYNILAGGGGISAALDALGAALTSDKMLNALGNLGTQILNAITGIDWAGIGTALWNGFLTAIDYIQDVGGPILEQLGDLTAALSGWIWNKASAVNWGGILSSAASKAGDITGTIVSKIGDLATALSGWLTQAANAIPWSTIGSTASDITGTIVQKIGDLGVAFKTWYDNAINSVQWGSLGEQVGTKVGDLTRTLAPKAWELITGLGTAISENWQQIGTILLGLVLGLPAAIGYIGATLGPKALEFIQGFVDGLNINWPLIGGWLSALPGKALAATPGLLSTLAAKGRELISGLFTAATGFWNSTASPWLASIGAKAIALVGTLLSTLAAAGGNLIRGLYTAASNYWTGTVSPWLTSLPGKATSATANLVSSLVDHGWNTIRNFLGGMQGGWGEVASWFSGLPGELAGWGSGLAGSLVDAGWNVMRGFLSGLQGGWDEVTGFLSGLNPLDYKGPEARDKAFLIPAGIWTMEGYQKGLETGWKDVTRTLSSFVPSMASGLDASINSSATANRAAGMGSRGNTTIYQTNQFDIHMDELEDVVEAARFVRDIDTNRTLYFEGAN